MKLIKTMIPKELLERSKEELGKVQVFRMTAYDVQGFRHEGADESAMTAAEKYRQRGQSSMTSEPMVQLVIAVNEDFVEPTIGAILRAKGQSPGLPGGEKDAKNFGRIFVLPLEECVRIRTGERGPAAI